MAGGKGASRVDKGESCVFYSYDEDYDDYICKPIDIMKFNEILKNLDII